MENWIFNLNIKSVYKNGMLEKEERMTTEELEKMPKIELHCHLDGSLSREFIERRLARSVSEEELSVSDDCSSLIEYLEKFDLPLECLQSEAGLTEAGYDVLKTMSRENIIYAEIRFAPLLSVTEEIGTRQVIQALLKGLEKGKKDFGVEYNVIVCAMRHHSMEQNYEMIKIASEFLGKGVCAADLAGAEAQYPMAEFMELFYKVKKLGIPFTIHAGECGNPQNIEDALTAGAGRIGHGIAMREKQDIKEFVKNHHIGIEMCPISNLQTKAVKSVNEYPLREFLDVGLLVTINTDNRTVSNTSMTKELKFVQEAYGISDEEVRVMMKNAIEVSFAGEEVKGKLRERIIEN